MFYRVNVPRYGSIYAQAINAGLARLGVSRFLARQGNSSYEVGAAQEVSSVPFGVDIVNSSGNLVFLPPPQSDTPSNTPPEQPQSPPANSSGSQGSFGGSSTPGENPQLPAQSPPTPSNGNRGGSQGSFGDSSTPGENPSGETPSSGSGTGAGQGTGGGSATRPPARTDIPPSTSPIGSDPTPTDATGINDDGYQVYRVSVPGYGLVWVDAKSGSTAVSAAVTFVRRQGISISETDVSSIVAVPVGAIAPDSANGIFIERSGISREVVGGKSLYKIDVPPIGSIYVVASSAELALQAARSHASGYVSDVSTLSFGSPSAIDYGDLPMDTSPDLVIDQDGASRDDLLGGQTDDASGEFSLPANFFGSGDLPVIVKYTVGGGDRRINGVRGVTVGISDEQLLTILPAGSSIEEVVTLQELFDRKDAEIIALWRRAGGESISSAMDFIQSLGVFDGSSLTANQDDEDSDENDDNSDESETDPTDGATGDGTFADDLQAFPLATYLNAIEGLGFNPNGVLGGILTNRFYQLNPALTIGQALGTINPAGNVPGALAGQYQDLFSNLNISGDVFRDLLAAEAAGRDEQAITDFTTPNISGSGRASEVLALARAAAAERYGSFFANNVLPSYQRLVTEYERLIAEANGEPEQSFLDFARQQSLLPTDF